MNSEQKNKYDINKIKIEKKKTFDYQNSNKLLEIKSDKNIKENEKVNQIHIITNIHFDEKKTKNYINDINKHFISIRSKYKRMSLNKNNYDIKKKLAKNIELEDKAVKNEALRNLNSSPSFVKNKNYQILKTMNLLDETNKDIMKDHM